MKIRHSLIGGLWLSISIGIVHADQPAIEWTGAGEANAPAMFVLGYHFQVTVPVTVTGLGAYDSNGDGLLLSHAVAIWSDGGVGPFVKATVPSGVDAMLIGHFRYVPISPFVLGAGDYIVGASNYGNGQDAYAAGAFDISNAPGITWVDDRFTQNSETVLAFPFQQAGFGTGVGSFGGSFLIEAVPEPSSYLLFLSGFTALLLIRRRQQQKARPFDHFFR